jgi:predicted nucleic acid-binding Zn ribbon protein
MRLLATMSGTVDDLLLDIGALPREAAIDRLRSFQRLAARLADGTEAAKFRTVSPLLRPLLLLLQLASAG